MLSTDDATFRFVYTRGALTARSASSFVPLAAFPELFKAYESDRLFPLFSNRLLPSSRPEFPQFLRWLGLGDAPPAPLAILARSGGGRATDNLEVFPCPEPAKDGVYEARFFLRGLAHMAPVAVERANRLAAGERLCMLLDIENVFDTSAVALRSADADGPVLLGYCPRYLSEELVRLPLARNRRPVITVSQVNIDAPLQFRVLCHMQVEFGHDFLPFQGEEYQPLVSSPATPALEVA